MILLIVPTHNYFWVYSVRSAKEILTEIPKINRVGFKISLSSSRRYSYWTRSLNLTTKSGYLI